ncbi:MAG: hypothetical protein OEZ39_14085 [Gammaproteobacteria bacterium]|nr:hypothetical protein [Gammaproteobacteria bacterium]
MIKYIDATQYIRHSFLTLAGLSLMLFAACSGGGGGTSNQDAGGIYTGTGTLGGTGYSDLKGIIHNNKLMIFSVNAQVLYDGTVTSITGDSFTASVNVYDNGALDSQSPVTLTGKVMSESHFNGTFANSGTGKASGSFDLTYNAAYKNKTATFNRIDTDANGILTGTLYGSQNQASTFLFRTAIQFGFGNDLTTCGTSDVPVTYSSQVNVYLLSTSFTITDSGGPVCSYSGTSGLTGMATLVNGSGTDNELWIAFSNGSAAFFSVATR